MATLADSFLQDLDDLEDDIGADEDQSGQTLSSPKAVFGDGDNPEAKNGEASATHSHPLISHLSTQADFQRTMELIRQLSSQSTTCPSSEGEETQGRQTLPSQRSEPQENEGNERKFLMGSEYQLIDQCNQLVTKTDLEILNIYSYIRDLYSKRFPELESIVFSPLEYIATVQRIKNESDLTRVSLADILPTTVTMAVTVASSMTTGQPLPQEELQKVLSAAEEAIQLADCRKDILLFLESRMDALSPNVSAIIGAALAARLIVHAGGVISLARMPAQNIMLVGSTGTTAKTTGGSSSTGGVARGVIYNSDLIQSAPQSVRNRALKLVAGKVSLAARVDSFGESPSGDTGRAFREFIVRSLIKAQEPPPAPMRRALPVPDDGPKKRRGGKRHRRAKEKYGASEFRKQANRLAFGEAEDQVGQETEGIGLGMIGKGTHGKLRLQAKQQKVQVKQQRKQQRRAGGLTEGHPASISTVPVPSSGATGGMSSSLAFTPLQGIELTNPEQYLLAQQSSAAKPEMDYFSSTTGFMKVEAAKKNEET